MQPVSALTSVFPGLCRPNDTPLGVHWPGARIFAAGVLRGCEPTSVAQPCSQCCDPRLPMSFQRARKIPSGLWPSGCQGGTPGCARFQPWACVQGSWNPNLLRPSAGLESESTHSIQTLHWRWSHSRCAAASILGLGPRVGKSTCPGHLQGGGRGRSPLSEPCKEM